MANLMRRAFHSSTVRWSSNPLLNLDAASACRQTSRFVSRSKLPWKTHSPQLQLMEEEANKTRLNYHFSTQRQTESISGFISKGPRSSQATKKGRLSHIASFATSTTPCESSSNDPHRDDRPAPEIYSHVIFEVAGLERCVRKLHKEVKKKCRHPLERFAQGLAMLLMAVMMSLFVSLLLFRVIEPIRPELASLADKIGKCLSLETGRPKKARQERHHEQMTRRTSAHRHTRDCPPCSKEGSSIPSVQASSQKAPSPRATETPPRHINASKTRDGFSGPGSTVKRS